MTAAVRFVASADEPRGGPEAERTIVLDTAWTPDPDEARRTALRPAFAAVLEGRDLFAEALRLIDAWAEAVDARSVLEVEGVTYWYRLRETLWHWVHERLLWDGALDALDVGWTPGREVEVPADEVGLIDVLRARGLAVVPPPAVDPAAPSPGVRPRPRRRAPAPVRWLRRVIRGSVPRTDPGGSLDRTLAERLRALERPSSRRILAIAMPNVFQSVGSTAGRRDPNLASVVDALDAVGLETFTLGSGMPRTAPDLGPLIASTPRFVPGYAVADRWGRPADADDASSRADAVCRRVDGLTAPVLVGGRDLGDALRRDIRGWCGKVLRSELGELQRADRLLADVRPAAIVMTHEGHRTPWLVAGARHGIPTFAVQHGILYPSHPGYPDGRDPRVVLPSRTFVYGRYEERVLMGWGYRADEVQVSGSPRLDLDDPPTGEARNVERERVRRAIGVADGDQLLVVSTTHLGYLRRSHVVHMVARVLGGPLPGVHVVFKQHPGERDEGPYRRLLEGLARAGGYTPPPISVVHDIDLLALLRAADAHLGQHSTVLSDAVVAGSPNLIATIEGGPPILDYVAAGVARPVRDVAELRHALVTPAPPDARLRQAFLDDHFAAGPAGSRIAEALRAVAVRGPAS